MGMIILYIIRAFEFLETNSAFKREIKLVFIFTPLKLSEHRKVSSSNSITFTLDSLTSCEAIDPRVRTTIY